MDLIKNFFKDKGRLGVAIVCLLMLSVAIVSSVTGNTYAAETIDIEVIFDGNASNVSLSEEKRTIYISPGDGTTYETLPSAERDGYAFLGWFTASTGGTQVYKTSLVTAADHTLYAHWRQVVSTVDCEVTFNTNCTGDLNCDSAVLSEYKRTVTVGEEYDTLPTGTRTGYKLVGWQMSDGTEVKSTSKVLGGDHTLYAVWAKNSYTISFNANGGSGAPSQVTKEYYSTFTISSTEPTQTGYTFKGWGTTSTATSASYQSGDTYTIKGNATLYAVWEKNSYTISFNANGGSGAPSNVTKEYNSTFTISSTKPTKTGYTFKGWGTTSTATSASYQPGDSYTVKGNATLHALWTGNPYKVNYNSNGGTGTMTDSSHTYGTASNLTANTFTRTGYTFSGWNTEVNGSGTKYADKASVSDLVTTNNGTITLYAQWTANKYTVKYDKNEGTGNMADSSHIYGTASNLTANTFTRENYTFDGWNTKADGTGTTYNDKASVSTLVPTNNGSITLYAQWKQNGSSSEENPLVTYTVKYNSNGGTGTMTDSEYIVGEYNQLKINTFERENYTFNGWNTEEDGSGTSYKDGIVIEDESFNNGDVIELYAQWVADDTEEDNNDNEEDNSTPPTTEEDNDNLEEGDNPDTGSLATILVTLIGIGAIGGIFYYRRKAKI